MIVCAVDSVCDDSVWWRLCWYDEDVQSSLFMLPWWTKDIGLKLHFPESGQRVFCLNWCFELTKTLGLRLDKPVIDKVLRPDPEHINVSGTHNSDVLSCKLISSNASLADEWLYWKLVWSLIVLHLICRITSKPWKHWSVF